MKPGSLALAAGSIEPEEVSQSPAHSVPALPRACLSPGETQVHSMSEPPPELEEQRLLVIDDPAGETPTPRPGMLQSDTLAQSLIALLVLAVAQRAAGFVRSILVCRWLSPDQLGEWDLANRFFVLAAPLVVLGIPGSFGRYLEHYRRLGALRAVLWRSISVCAVLAFSAVAVMLLAPEWFAEQVFGRADRASSVALVASGLVAVIAYNYLTEMLDRAARWSA